ncbi:hypothetical protein [Acinetobacter phage ABPH49]|nr:hypothetical protein [Acinetobacter phage ABPH49]
MVDKSAAGDKIAEVELEVKMKVEIRGRLVEIDERQYVAIPLWWMHIMSDADFKKMCLLRQRYDFFARQALEEDRDCNLMRVMWESQQELGVNIGFSRTSRSRVSEFLSRMEELGIIEVIRETYIDRFGKKKPKHYLTVKDDNLLESYGRSSWTGEKQK